MPDPLINIRPMRPADVPAITDIYAHAVKTSNASWEWSPPEAAEMQRRCEAVTTQGYPWLVAVSEGQVAGYAYASAFRHRDAYQWVVEESVYVSPDHARKGIGKLLIQSLIDICSEGGYRQMVGIIGGSDNVASIRLHETLGFRHAGLLPGTGWKDSTWHDWVLMTRPLGEAAATPPQIPPAGLAR